MAKAKAKRSFEELLAEAETIIDRMEEGELSLDELLKQYGEGVELIRLCREKLTVAEDQLAAQQMEAAKKGEEEHA